MATVYAYTASRVARQKGVKDGIRAERDRVAEIARGLFAEHDNPGGHEITTSNSRRTDAFVNLDGPAPLSVEYGHWTADLRNPTHNTFPTHVEGLHILGRAIAQAAL